MSTPLTLLRHGVDIGRAVSGLHAYRRSGEATEGAWRSLLSLHCRTNGRSSDWFAKIVRRMRPPRAPTLVSGIVGSLSVAQQGAIAAQIAKDGYYVFDRLAPREYCDEIERFARTTPAIVEGRGGQPDERVVFDPAAPISKTYRLPAEDIITSPALQRLMGDQALLAVAESYLAAHPILASVNLWWSPSFGSEAGDDAAQMFHFDFDGAPIWLKFFIYLTDVDRDNGPHVFVRGSHAADHRAAAEILKRGYVRVSDDEIAEAFGADNVIEICGPRGTVLAVDTRGFHKGKMPMSGYRLIAQAMFCCPQFNFDSPRYRLPADIGPVLSNALQATPDVFERFR